MVQFRSPFLVSSVQYKVTGKPYSGIALDFFFVQVEVLGGNFDPNGFCRRWAHIEQIVASSWTGIREPQFSQKISSVSKRLMEVLSGNICWNVGAVSISIADTKQMRWHISHEIQVRGENNSWKWFSSRFILMAPVGQMRAQASHALHFSEIESME